MRLAIEDTTHTYFKYGQPVHIVYPGATCPYCGVISSFKKWYKPDSKNMKEVEFEGRHVHSPGKRKCKHCKKVNFFLVYKPIKYKSLKKKRGQQEPIEVETNLFVLDEIYAVMPNNISFEMALDFKGKLWNKEEEELKRRRSGRNYH